MTITVSTQAELDAALAAFESLIYIDSPEGVWLTIADSRSSRVVAWGSSRVEAWGSSRVVARGSSSVVAWGSSSVEARESSRVEAWGSSRVEAWGSSRVVAWGSSSVVAWGSSRVVARESSRVEAWGSSRVEAWGSSSVVAWGSSSVEARESSRVVAWGSSRVVARGSSSVVAWGSSSVEARESSRVEAWGSSRVEAWGSSSVVARTYVAVHLHSARATVTGGVLIDLAALDLSNPETWADFHGAEVADGHVVVYKAVDDDLRSGRGFAYPLGETVEAKDWKPTDTCGAGLHFGPTPRHARDYFAGATRFLACRIPLAAAKGITDGGTAKLKAQSCEVLYEVDLDGARMDGAA